MGEPKKVCTCPCHWPKLGCGMMHFMACCGDEGSEPHLRPPTSDEAAEMELKAREKHGGDDA